MIRWAWASGASGSCPPAAGAKSIAKYAIMSLRWFGRRQRHLKGRIGMGQRRDNGNVAMRRNRPSCCTVCRHPERLRIELMRLSGASLDIVAAKFSGTHRDALHRHMKFHLDEGDKKALIDALPMRELIARAAEEGGSVMDYLGLVRNVVMRALLGAADAGDRIGTASLSGRA